MRCLDTVVQRPLYQSLLWQVRERFRYLRRFPVDCLKIDRAFISNLGIDGEDTEIVRAIITLAQTLGMTVTAEGVETDLQAGQLRGLGCDWGQGFLFARPLPIDAVHALLDSLPTLPG